MLGNGLHRSFGTEDVGIAFIAMQSSNIFIVTALKLGITGWAQVNGLRGGVDKFEKAHTPAAHDLYYIEHCSLWLDLKILPKTAGVVMSRKNAY